MKRGLLTVAGAAILAGCATSPSLVQTTSDGVTVQYDSAYSNVVDATATADKACAKNGRHAELAGDEFKGNDVHIATFKCVQ